MSDLNAKGLKVDNMTKHDSANFSDSFVAKLRSFTSVSRGPESSSKPKLENNVMF